MKIKSLILATAMLLTTTSLFSCQKEDTPAFGFGTSQDVETVLDKTESTNDIIVAQTEFVTKALENVDTETVETTSIPAPSEVFTEDSTFSIHYIDVGQADAALIECDGEYMLIDGGNVEDSNLVYSVLERNKATNLDIVVGTHAHEDHIGGLSGALNYATADLVLCPVTEYESKAFNDFKALAEEKSNGITVPSVNDTYTLGSAEVEILGVNSTDDTNNSSIVLMIEYGETKFLFTGDAEREAEQVILESGADLSCDVLKVGHHGSDTSTSYVWLNEIMPEYAVISVGAGNTYNHPTDETLSRLRDADTKTYRTDLNGDIYATSDGKEVTLSTDRTATTEQIFTAGSVSKTQDNVPATKNEKPAPEQQESVSNNSSDYILNTNSLKFHIPSCSSAEKISDKNRKDYTGTRESLIEQGYSPCGYCNP